jgi:putative ABC transport system permease protein
MHSIKQDFQHGMRLLRKTPFLAVIIVITLGAGIGINTIAFSWVSSILYHPLSGVDATISRLVVILQKNRFGGDGHEISYLEFQDITSHREVFSGGAGDHHTQLLMRADNQSDWVWTQVVTPGFFDFYGIKPQIGRCFSPEEAIPGKAPVVVISYKLWKNRFGSDPKILGKKIELNRSSFIVVGVVPAEFKGSQAGLSYDLWAPVSMAKEFGRADLLTDRSARNLKVTARLQPGVTLAQAQAFARTVSEQLGKAYPDTNRDNGLKVLAFTDAPYSLQGFLPLLKVFMLAVILLLSIIAANITNLVLARSASRRLEISIRLALGAGRFQLFLQFLIESMALTLAGAILGLSLSLWGSRLFLNFIPPTHLPVNNETLLAFNWQNLIYALVLAFLLGLVLSFAQTMQNRPSKVYSTIKEGGRSGLSHRHSHRLSNLLVVTEMTLASVVLIGAGLCGKSLYKTLSISPGFDPAHVLLAGVTLTPDSYTEKQGKLLFHRIQEKIHALPGIDTLSMAGWVPLGFEGGPIPWVKVEGYQPRPGEDMGICEITVSYDYFKTMHIPLLEGRDFRPNEGEQSQNSVIVNQAFVDRFWPGRNALGRRLRVYQKDCVVIGVSRNCKYQKLSEPQQAGIYLNSDQFYSSGMALHVRSQSNSPSLLAAIQKEIYSVDSHVKINAAVPLPGYIKANYTYERMLTVLLAGVGSMALVLACLGIYGVLNWSVSQRLGEIGIRMALGASPWKVMQMILFNGSLLMVIGLGLGLVLSALLSQYLPSFLAGVQSRDPLIYSSVCGLLVLVGWLACYLPARRAASTDPMTVLRGE